MRALFLVAVLLVAATASAQTQVDVLPPSPTTSHFVTLRVRTADTRQQPTVTREGNHFRLYSALPRPIIFPPPPEAISLFNVRLGALPAGSYTYEVVVATRVVLGGSFVVAAATPEGIPALSTTAMLILGLSLGTVGWMAVRRL
jgi:hypothetical protein